VNIRYAAVRELHEAAIEQWMLGNDEVAGGLFREITRILELQNGDNTGRNRERAARSDQTDQDGRAGIERSGDQSGQTE
jgi:hypothetical protein